MTDGCDSYLPLMHADIDGDISTHDLEKLNHHLDSCESCNSTYSSLTASVDLFAAMPAPVPGPAFAAVVVAKALATKKARERTTLTVSAAAAAVVAVAAALSIGVWAGLVEPTLPGLLWGIPKMLAGLAPAVALLGRIVVPLLNAAATLAVDSILTILPLYLISLVCITLVSLLMKARKPLTTLPVLTI